MATPDQLSNTLRQATLRLRARTVHDLLALWPSFDGTEKTFLTWLSSVGLIIERDRKVATGLAEIYLKAFRKASNVTGTAVVIPAPLAPDAQVAASMAATTFPVIRKAASVEEGLRTAFVTSSGAASRLVVNGSRDTITGSLRVDREAVGWHRITSGRPCAFCALLASRGAVYKSEATADFKAHDHCHCIPEPVYQGGSTLPKGPAAGWARLYTEQAAGHKDQINAFRRAYEAA